jgi:hypothetical protein
MDMGSFMFPGTAALMLRTQTWLSDIAIECALRRYSVPGAVFFIKDRRPGPTYYRVEGASGGFRFAPVVLGAPRAIPSVLPPF